MEPKMEQPKQYTPEEMAQLEKSRTASDKALGDGGAEFVFNESGEKKNLLVTGEQVEHLHNNVERELNNSRTIIMRQMINDIESFFEKGDRSKEDFEKEIKPKIRTLAYDLHHAQGIKETSVEKRSANYEPEELVTCPHCQAVGLVHAGRLDLAKKIFNLHGLKTSSLGNLWEKRGE